MDFFVRNGDVLLNDTNVKTLAQNTKRNAAYKKLLNELQEEFGFETNEKKIQNHFDHIRSRVVSKGMAFKKGLSAEKRYRMATGGGNSWEEEANFSKNNDCHPFNTDSEEILWRYYDKTPMTEPFKKGESMVGKRKLCTEHYEENEAEAEPIMDDFESDSDHCDVPSKRKRITEDFVESHPGRTHYGIRDDVEYENLFNRRLAENDMNCRHLFYANAAVKDFVRMTQGLHYLLELRRLNAGDVVQYTETPLQRSERLLDDSSSFGVLPVKPPLPDVILCCPLPERRHHTHTPGVGKAGIAQEAISWASTTFVELGSCLRMLSYE
ncbi:unnamed protein product [Cylicocyclus nassatus]|uniref:Uncharacterized protein n=1 Tax=Cylicocyclus nassatus TaxID=53992 RepID=A0AA36MBX5_CYLNA|nr:unnamed protein product [Cylicocyclus nassatus]